MTRNQQQGSTSYRTVRRHLFGSAITAELPQSFIDASELRQVPDNQEVLISSSSDASIIVEVLESVKEGAANSDMKAAAEFHFESLAHDNSALSSTVETVSELDTSNFPMPPALPRDPGAGSGSGSGGLGSSGAERLRTPSPWILAGTQVVPKYGRTHDPPHCVRILLAVWRLRPLGKDVDLVMTFNIPRALPSQSPGQSQGQSQGQGEAQHAAAEQLAEQARSQAAADETLLTEVFHKAASTLTIEDWGLFP